MISITGFTPNNGNINFTAQDRPESKLFYEFIAVTKDGSEPLRVKVYQTDNCWRACVWVHFRYSGGETRQEIYSIGKASHNFRHYDKGMIKAIKDALTSCGFDFESLPTNSTNDADTAKQLVHWFATYVLNQAWLKSARNANHLDKFVVLTVVAAHG